MALTALSGSQPLSLPIPHPPLEACKKSGSNSALFFKEPELLDGAPEPIKKEGQYPRSWHFLTLGIPRLIEALGVFFDGIVHREKKGAPLSVRFTVAHLNKDEIELLNKFHSLQDKKGTALLSVHEFDKARALVEQLKKVLDKAETERNCPLADECRTRLRCLSALLEKNKNLKLKRKQFSEEDWQTLDLIKYELTREGFEDLTLLFNSEWFQNYNISERVAKFGVDYNEAVVAEVLALSLAYIEGLDGRTIRLPVFDPSIRLYRPAVYSIKKAVLGDALPCYILESDDPLSHPWFIIRGTQRYTTMSSVGKEYREGSFESILADVLDHKCISRHIINKALVHRPIVQENDQPTVRESIGDCFRRWRQQRKKALLAGHSLAGTLVNALAVEFYDDIKTGYSFSGTGVSVKLESQWKAIKKTRNVAKTAFEKLVNFDHEGDMIPAGGRRLIGLHLAIESLKHVGPNGIYQSHVRGHLNRDFKVQRVDVLKENSKLARSFCERIRIIIGTCLRFLLTLFSGNYLPDWWTNRRVYKKYASTYRSSYTGDAILKPQ